MPIVYPIGERPRDQPGDTVQIVRAHWTMPVEAIADELATDVDQGLTGDEAAARLARDGPNELVERPPVAWYLRLASQFTDPLVVLLLVAIVISLIAWWSDGASETPLEAIVIAAIVVLNAGIGFWQELKAVEAVAALRKLSATHTSVLRDGRVARVPSDELVVGDVIALAEGDAVAADCRLFEVSELHVAEASLTGESVPVVKDTAPLTTADGDDGSDIALGDRTNMVFSGTAVTRGRGEGIVVATGMRTEIGHIATLLDAQTDDATPLQRQVSWLGRQLGIAVVVLSAVVVAAIIVTAEDRSFDAVIDALLVGVSLAVAAVPEGLPAILSVVLALGVQRMARENAVVKRLSSVETLGSASVICTDKTGTLTRNEMTIVRVVTASGSVDITGVGYEPVGHAVIGGRRVTDPSLLGDVEMLLRCGSLANDASLAVDDAPDDAATWTILGDPTEAAFLVAEAKVGGAELRAGRFDRVAEIPFSSERRRMATLHVDSDHDPDRDGDGGFLLVVKGAPEVLLDRCTSEYAAGREISLTDSRRATIEADVAALADDALRTISVAYRRTADGGGRLDEGDERDLVHIGVVGILDPPRPEVARSIAEAHRAGVRIIMITGDHPVTAARIGAALDIHDTVADGGGRSVTGADLAELTDAEFRETVRHRSVFARVAPEHKLRIVEALQSDGQIVAMTGDGVNDAPALRKADIGVAMGMTGTEVSKEASDMILADDNFATILRSVREGREIFADIRKVLRYLLASNGGEVLVMLVGVLAAGVLGLRSAGAEAAVPLLATQILWINLLTDGALAMALGVDPSVSDVMDRPPRGLNDRVIDRPMLRRIVLLAVVSAISALAALDIGLDGGLLGGSGDIETARTMAFSTLVIGQVFDAFNSRSPMVSAFVRPFENRLLWVSALVTILLQVAVVHLPFMQTAFHTSPLDATDWLWCIGLASIVLWTDEARKLLARRHTSHHAPGA